MSKSCSAFSIAIRPTICYNIWYEYNSNTFVYNLINSHTTVDNHIDEDGDSNYDVYYLQDIIYCYNLYSQVYYSEEDFYPGRIKQADDPDLSADIVKCDGISVPINTDSDSNFESIKQHFLYNVQQRLGIVLTDTYDIIVPTKWKKITLKSKLTPNGTTNSDTDALTDWEEVDTSKLKINSDNSIELPVFCMADLIGYLTRFNTKGEYNFLINDINPRYYLPILSDPTDEDTDDDGLNDDVDKFPKQNFTINLNNCIEKIQNIEKYLKDYLSEIGQDRNDYMDYCMFLIRTQVPKYTGLKWALTAGNTYVDGKFVKYLNAKDKTCLEYFQTMDAHPIYDVYGNEIDFLHLIATLTGQYNKSSHFFIDEDLSGWLGDLQSFIYDLKIATYGTNKDLKDTALKLIATGDTKFDSTDMFADIDAKNISCIYDTNNLLSHTIEDYYQKYTSKRFNLFINNSGGIDSIKEKAKKYTSQSLNPSHQLLTSFADEAANETINGKNLTDIFLSNYYIDENGVHYTLEIPNIVTKEESEALVYAFVTYIQNGKEKEDER